MRDCEHCKHYKTTETGRGCEKWLCEFEREWHDIDEPPTRGEYVLLSFSNFSVPLVGRYEEDETGGAFYIGDELTSAASQEIFVNGWLPLPKCKGD